MKLRDVHHLTDDQGALWSKFIHAENSLQGFKELLEDWDGLVDDVCEIVDKWTPKDFNEFRKCIALEKKGVFTGEENARRFAAVMMPSLLFKASMVADQFKVPWGLACLRLVECDPEFEDLKVKK